MIVKNETKIEIKKNKKKGIRRKKKNFNSQGSQFQSNGEIQ